MMKRELRKIAFMSLFAAAAFTAKAQTQVYTEAFSANTLPAGWTNDSMGSPAFNLWDFTNTFGRVITGAGFDGSFVIFDSDQNLTNDGIPEFAQLTTDQINISAVTAGQLFLQLDEQYRALGDTLSGGSGKEIE